MEIINLTALVYMISGGATLLAVICGSAIGWFKKQEKEFVE
jgi:hypothetical protein